MKVIKLFFWNLWLTIRLWFYRNTKSRKLDNKYKPSSHKDNWVLTFEDNFTSLDLTKWRTDAYYGHRYHPGPIESKGESPKEYYSPDCFEANRDTLKLVAKNEPIEIHYKGYDGKDWGKWIIDYQVGQLDSSKSFEQRLGYFELRCKLPSSTGMWPAFWLASTYDWPPEVDIFEIYTGKNFTNFSSNVHWGDTPNKKMKPQSHKVYPVDEDFHIYACEWKKDYIKFYYDEVLVRVVKTPDDFFHPMHIIINQGIDTKEGRGLNDDAVFPNYFELDYVRAYKY